MSQADQRYEMADELGHAYALVQALAQKQLDGSQSSLGDFVALAVLDSVGDPLSQSEWARLSGVSRQRCHVVAHRLQQAGFIALRREGRNTEARLSEVGAAWISRQRRAMGELFLKSTAGFSSSQVKQLTTLLSQLVSAIEQPAKGTKSSS